MTECRRKTISVAASPFGQPSTPRLPRSTRNPSPDSLLHLTERPFDVVPSSVTGGTFLFGTPVAPKKKLSNNSLFSPEKRVKRTPFHESNKSNVSSTHDNTSSVQMLSLESHNSPSPSSKRHDVTSLNLDQASLGLSVSKRPPRRQASSHFHHTHPSSPQSTDSRRLPSHSVSNQTQPLPNPLHQQVKAQHFEFSTPVPPNSKVSRRVSVENFLRPPSRESPFGVPAPILDASIHLPQQIQQTRIEGRQQKPHPLSFAESAFSTPSSDSSNPHPQATRPQNPRLQNLADSQSLQNFYTPQAYKMAKPLQAAFMSEGLLSKRNRSNSTDPPHMPETPCKQPLSGTFGVFPIDPSTPLSGHPRHGSLLFDGDSNSSQDTPAPSNHRSLSYLSTKSDFEFPPTPTKSVDNLGSTPGPLWRVHNLSKSPGGDSIGSNDGFHISVEFPEVSPPKEHRRRSATNGRLFQQYDIKGGRFGEKFEDSQIIGTGEFSEVYEAVERVSGMRYAVKRTRFPMSGPKERQRRLEEVRTLKALGSHEHILGLVDSWEQYDHLFIQTELCENGSLDVFLRDYGNIERLDEFRVWKILIELSAGLQYIHDCNYIHLDIKPANVFITVEGKLKIGDFGMATTLPIAPNLEREGDREYIAPEILELQQYGKPADVFSLGMTILETAANVCLPDNGPSWQKLRNGDLSDAPRLSSNDIETVGEISMNVDDVQLKGLDGGKLDDIVRWMLSPDPTERPSCRDILENEVVRWVDRRRSAGAVIFEGEFGPSEDDVIDGVQLKNEEWQMGP